MTTERSRLLLVAALCLGGVLRLGHFAALSRTGFLETTTIFSESDQYAFWQWAQQILAGDILGRETYHPYTKWMQAAAPLETWYRWWGGERIFCWAPLYPYSVAALLALKNSLGFVVLMQLLVGSLHPLVIFSLAKHLFDVRVGVIAAALTALYGPFILHQGVLLRDWLPPLLEPLALLALLRARASGGARGWLMAGSALGLAILTKETFVLFVPLALLWLAWEYRGALRQVGPAAGALLVGLSLTMSPLIVRNRLVGAPPFALSASGGVAIAANSADAIRVDPYSGFRVEAAVQLPAVKEILQRGAGRPLTIVRETLDTYGGEWSGLVRLAGFKLRGLVDPLEVPNNVSWSYGLELSPPLHFTLRYGMVAPLGVTGCILSAMAWRRHLLLFLYGLATVAGLMVPNILARYRLVLVPLMIVYGAAAMVWMLEALRARHTRKAVLVGGLIGSLAVAQHFLLPIRALREDPVVMLYPPDYLVAAQVHAGEGRFDLAVAEIGRLRSKAGQNPRFSGLAADTALEEAKYRAMWAQRLMKEGRPEEARVQVELARLVYAEHLHSSDPNFVLGLLYTNLGEPQLARPFFERFPELEPQGERAGMVRSILGQQERPDN